jgi:non-heme chloroperoxidase
MPYIKSNDGTSIFYKDFGQGQPIVFSHGWPLSADEWDNQIFYFSTRGYRCIAHDRRGHGRSDKTFEGNDMDTYADDLAALTKTLNLKDAIHVGHSTGGGEVTRYIGRHGTSRVAQAVLIGAVPPVLLKSDSNPDGLPMELFDSFREAHLADRAQFWLDTASGPFYGFNRPGAKISQGLIDGWWRQAMMADYKATYDCIKAFSETDFHEDLKKFDVPTLIMHGDDDQVVPIAISAMKSSKLVPNSTLKVYPGFPHGMATNHHDVINADLLEFIQTEASQAAPAA